MSQVTTVELHGSATGSGHRRRPPKLKTIDRTVSMVVDNYTPLTSAALSAKNAGPLVINMDGPHSASSRRASPNIEDIFRGHNQSSNSMENTINCDDDYPHPSSSSSMAGIRKSSSFRRGETIDMMDLPSTMSTSLQHLRKTPSFHSSAGPNSADDETIQIVPLSRHYSARHHTHPTTPSTFKTFVHHAYQQKQQQQNKFQDVVSQVRGTSSSSARRNCTMHRSFHEPQKRPTHSKREMAAKSNSFSSDEQQPPVQIMYQQQQHSSMQFPAKRNSSIESDMYRSRSNSRSNSQALDEQQSSSQFLDVWKPSPMPSPQPGHSRKSPSPRPTSSNSLDQVLNQQNSMRNSSSFGAVTAKMIRQQQAVSALNPQFLAPIPLLALDNKSFENVYQVKSPVFDMKKSYSLKYKNGHSSGGSSKENRELFKSRKSKSFITDNEPLDIPFTLSPNLSPAALSASGSVKKHHSPMISPLPQGRNKMFLEDMKRRSGDGADLLPQDPSTFPVEFGGLDFNTIYKSYRAQQKVSANRRHKNRRKKSSSSIKNDGDFDSESITKRKKIVCIVMVVFAILVVFSVLAVIVTLTHASVAQVQNQTRHIYTFSRDSRPIHYPAGGGGGN